MELMLKIDLTEEQYNDLMTKSYHELFETDSFKKALAATVSEGILDFLKSPTGQNLIKKTFTGDSYYDSGRNTDFGKKIFDEASKDYMDQIKEPIGKFLQDCLMKVDIDRMAKAIVMNAFIKGMAFGASDDLMRLQDQLWMTEARVNDLRSKFNIYD